MGGSAIRNVVFDMGGVLMRFDTDLFSHLYVDDDKDAQAIADALFNTTYWSLLDSGTISEATVEATARLSLPERLWPALHDTFATWHLHQPIIEDTNDLVVRLHEAGYGCYLLSNAGVRWWHQKDRIPCFAVMDGWLVSAWEHLMKPDPLIYQTLCERYGLRPEECLFVDDNAPNVAGARRAGMHGHVFTDAATLERRLRVMGVVL